MIARHFWTRFLIELALYVGLIAWLATRWHWATGAVVVAALLGIPILMLALRTLIVIGSFVAAGASEARPPLRTATWARMVYREILALMRFQYEIMLHTQPEHRVTGGVAARERPLIVLLHGIYCSDAVWRPIMPTLAERTGCDVLALSMDTATVDLAAQVSRLETQLQNALPSGDARPIIFVAHSLGGLIARRFIRVSSLRTRIAGLVCLATPHAGSLIARWLTTPGGRDLRPGCEALKQLECERDSIDVCNIFAIHDNLVAPSRPLSGARNVPIAGCGHMALLYEPTVFDLLVHEIQRICSAERSRAAH